MYLIEKKIFIKKRDSAAGVFLWILWNTTILEWISVRFHRFASSSFTLISVNSNLSYLPHSKFIKNDKTSLFFTSINYSFIKRWKQSTSQIFSDKITVLKYPFIVFSKKITIFWCIYIDKWYNSMYIFNHHFLHQ